MNLPAHITGSNLDQRIRGLNAGESSASRLRLTYAITPPNQTTSVERRRALAAAHSERIAALPIDALLVYDLQDEASRNGRERPFPFVPKVDPLGFAFDELRIGNLTRVIYRAVAEQEAAELQPWLDRLQAHGGHAVFVGAPSRQSRSTLTLPQAFSLCRTHAPLLSFGGVLIAERHQATGTEDERAWAKLQQGCGFFVSQTMWCAAATKSLLYDLRLRSERGAAAPVPRILLTLSPCGSEQTLRFQEWLGVNVPLAIRRELMSAKDMLARSVDLAAELFAEVHAFALQHGVTVGCNVESVSSRATEVEASLELVRRIAQYQSASRGAWGATENYCT